MGARGTDLLAARAAEADWVATTGAGSESIEEVLERYALLIELSPESIIVHQRGAVVYANAATCRLLGVLDPSELIGQLIGAYVHPDDVPSMVKRIASLAAPGAFSEATDLRIVRPDGRLCEVSAVSVRTTWRGSTAYQVVMRDLAGQRSAEAAVRYQAALVAHVSDAIIATDNEGTVTSWNPAAESMYGWTASDAVGRNVAEVIGVDPPLGEAVEAVHQRRDGTAIDARLSVAELRDDRDVVTGRVLVSSDITESKAAEQRHAAVVDSLQEGVVVLRADRTVESMNPVAQRLLGAGAEILYDNTGDTRMVTETGQPLERGKGHITAVRETGVAHEDVTLGLQRGDSTVWLSCTFRPLHTRRGAPYPIVISFRDITESRAAEAALQYQASHDALTGLASRPVIVETIRSFLHGDDRSDS
ncbi:MAG: hypothetical protein QOC60_331, partial [Frankiaceae bacterium]|nr:hypothetical protein [Frankiaceae bacterium]